MRTNSDEDPALIIDGEDDENTALLSNNNINNQRRTSVASIQTAQNDSLTARLRLPTCSPGAKVIAIGAFLHMLAISANFTYALISTRVFVCAAHYEQHPNLPGLHTHSPCRTPEVEVALASFIRNLCLITGLINPIAILFWGRFLRSLGPKRLALIANLSIIIFDPLPWLLLPVGPPVGHAGALWLSATTSKHVLLVSAVLGAATGMGNLHTLAFRTLLVDSASPSQVTAHLSLFAIAAYASTALGPLVSALVVNLVIGLQQNKAHPHNGALSTSFHWLQSWQTSTHQHKGHVTEPDIPYPGPGTSPPIMPPSRDKAVKHHRASFAVSLFFAIIALVWLLLFIRDRTLDEDNDDDVSTPRADEETSAVFPASSKSWRKSQTESAPSCSFLRSEPSSSSKTHPIFALLQPFRIILPSTLARARAREREQQRFLLQRRRRRRRISESHLSASSNAAPAPPSSSIDAILALSQYQSTTTTTSEPTSTESSEEESGHQAAAASWPIARILLSSVLIAAAGMANSPLMEYLTFAYAFTGTKLAFLLASQALVSALLVFGGVPALRAWVERTAKRPARLGDEVDLAELEGEESVAPAVRLSVRRAVADLELRRQSHNRTAAPSSNGHQRSTSASSRRWSSPSALPPPSFLELRRMFWDWQASIELGATWTILVVILVPWACILWGVAFPYSSGGGTGGGGGGWPVLLVLGWIFGSPDGTIGSFLQSAGLAILKSSSSDPSLVDDFMNAYSALATLVTLAASVWVTVYSWTVRTWPWLTFVFPTLLGLVSLAILRPLLGSASSTMGDEQLSSA
ncbi:hypothetical protein V8E36_002193 [Tilletia maclaganii]